MKALTDYPERLLDARVLYVGSEHRAYRVERISAHRGRVLLQVESITDRDGAEALRGELVYIRIEDAVPLEEGEYYLYQIEGIRVVTDEGQELGRLTGLIETGANDVYIITSPEGKEILIPAIPQVIVGVDVPGSVMTVHLLEGLL